MKNQHESRILGMDPRHLERINITFDEKKAACVDRRTIDRALSIPRNQIEKFMGRKVFF